MRSGNDIPIDRTAGLVTSRGESFTYRVHCGSTDSDAPLKTMAPTADHLATPGFVDLSGRSFGRLTVIGMSSDKKKRWVCRCCCGVYTLRRSAVIIAAEPGACCDQCCLLAISRRDEYRRRTGKDKPLRDFL